MLYLIEEFSIWRQDVGHDYHWVVKARTKNGDTLTIEGSGQNPGKYTIGQELKIL